MSDICEEQAQPQLSENKALPSVQSIHSLKVALTLKIWIILEILDLQRQTLPDHDKPGQKEHDRNNPLCDPLMTSTQEQNLAEEQVLFPLGAGSGEGGSWHLQPWD